MNSFIYQTKINFTRIILRNKRFFIFDMSLPIIFYLLYTRILSTGIPKSVLKEWNLSYLISMMIFACLLGSVITVANTLLENHTSHFDLFIANTPASKIQYYASLIVVFLFLNLISLITIALVGGLVNNVQLSVSQWILIILSAVINSIPLILIGFIVSLLKNPSAVNSATGMIVFPMAMLSGLWWPLSAMPNWLQTLGKLLPTQASSQIAVNIAHQNSFNVINLFNLLSWTFIIIVLLVVLTQMPRNKEIASQ